MKKLTALILAMVMMLSLFAGCKKTEEPKDPVNPDKGNPGTTEPGTADENGYLNLFISAEPKTLDVSRSSDSYGGYILTDINDPLTRLVDENGEHKLVGAGAKEWTTSEDGKVITFKLNENKWRDGTPVTAKDYVYAFQRLADPNTGAPLGYFLDPIVNYKDVQAGKMAKEEIGVKAIDDLTLEITLTAPTPHFMSLTSLRFMAPLNQAAVEKHGEAYGAAADKLESNGPFYVESWTTNSQIVLKKNPNYWDAANVKLETINYRIIGDENTYYNEFEIGGLDSVTTGKKEWLDRFEKKENVTKTTYSMPTVTFTFFNTKDALFQNVNIRKAFLLGLDREDINEVVFTGLREPSYGWVASAISVGGTSFREQAGDIIKDMATAEGDPKALLIKGMEELGLGNDPATLKIKFSLGGVDQWYRTMGEYLQQTFKTALGVNLEIETAEWPVFSENVEKGNFQMGMMAWGAFYNDPIDVLGIFRSTAGSVNTGWESAEFDALLDQASVEMDDAKRVELYKQAEKMLIVDNAIVSPMAFSTYNGFRYNYVNGFTEMAMTNYGETRAYTAGRSAN